MFYKKTICNREKIKFCLNNRRFFTYISYPILKNKLLLINQSTFAIKNTKFAYFK